MDERKEGRDEPKVEMELGEEEYMGLIERGRYGAGWTRGGLLGGRNGAGQLRQRRAGAR